MFVHPFDSPDRWIVESGDKRYLCDMAAFSGNGRCNCQHFQIYLQSQAAHEAGHRCKHLQKLFFVNRGEGTDPDPDSLPTLPLHRE